ncbi:hypothetical protein [Roseateles sp. P5_E7]
MTLHRPSLLASALLLCTATAFALPGQNPEGRSGTSTNAGSLKGGGMSLVESEARFSNVNVSGIANASLVDGTLHAYAWSSNNPTLPKGCRPDMLSCNWGIGADASMWETVTIKAGPKHKPGEVVTWSWDVGGFTSSGRWWSAARAYTWMYVGGDPNGWKTATMQDIRRSESHLSGSWEVPADGSSMTLYLYGGLSVYAEGGAEADYSHTARFGWTVPEGITVTSASGKFMTAGVSPVPESASAALMLSGLAVLPWLHKRRRRYLAA